MISLDDIKQQLLEAEKAASIPHDKYHEMARKLVNIERQSFYGDENERNSLRKTREAIDAAVKQGDVNEI